MVNINIIMERTVIWCVVVVAVCGQAHSESFTPIQYNDAQLNYHVPPPPPTIPVQRFEANRAMPMSSSSSIWSQELLNALQRNAPQPPMKHLLLSPKINIKAIII